jgi:hypothetical protein
MPATASPFGLRPSYSTSGIMRPEAFTLASGYNTDIFQYQPVAIGVGAPNDGTLIAGAPGLRIIGVFMGVEWTDSDGRRRFSNKWTANTVGSEIVAYSMRDQQPTVYEIQSNAALTIADVGKQYDWSVASGSAIVGISTQSLNVASAAANAGLRLLGLAPGPDNAWGDAFVNVRVQISEHQDVADVAAY